jgi:hypothetical protein
VTTPHCPCVIKEHDSFQLALLNFSTSCFYLFVHTSLFFVILFVMHSSYSPLFTWGLLADRQAGSSSANCPQSTTLSVDPSTSLPGASHKPHYVADDDHASAFYFTLQTGRRDTVEFRSFLSLDLADSNRSVVGHRRKPSNMSKSTSWTCTSDVTSAHDLSSVSLFYTPFFIILTCHI